MKLRWWIPVLALGVAGCVKEKIEVIVNPDGSGTIQIDTAMSAQAIGMAKQMTAGLGASLGGSNAAPPVAEPFIKDSEMRERAKDFGPGVEMTKLVRTTPDGGEGCIGTYTFSDIRKVRLPLKDNKGGGEDAAEDPSKNVTFEFTKGPTSTLVVHIPQQSKTAEPDAAAAKPEPGPEAAMMAGMMDMFKGMELRFAVQVNGKVISSTASYPQGNAKQGALLMAVNFDELRKTPEFTQIFTSSQGSDIPTDKLKGMPGFSYETKPMIAIEFK